MATLFTRILNGEIPGRFVYRDDRAGVFLTINPIQPGHALVVPIEEVDHWLDAPKQLRDHLMDVASKIGRAQMQAFAPLRIGVIVAGLEVPHLHIHVVPMKSERDVSFLNADLSPDEADLDKAADALRAALRSQGETAVI